MRILISTVSGDVVGGVETYLRALLPLLHARGHELALLCEVESRGGGPPIGSESLLAARISVERDGERGALEQARRFAPEVVYQQGVMSASLEEALLELAPAVFFAHAYRGTCISGAKRFAVPRMSPCSRRLGPACLLMYPVRRCGGLNPLTMRREYAAQMARGARLPRYRSVAVAGEHMAREIDQHGGAPRVIGGLLTWSLRPEAPQPRAQTGRVLLAGRLTLEKGVRPLVRAVDEAARSLGRPLVLRVAGSGPEEAWLRARGGVECLGWLSPEALRVEMEQADVLAMPSLWPEPFGLSGIEAGAVGLPAVAYAVGGIPDWLEAGLGGELAEGEPGSVPALAGALVKVLRDPERWQALRVGAWKSAHRFSGEAHARALEEVLRDVAGERSRAPAPAEDGPLVSIGIPTYQRAAYLQEAIESALAQRYPRIEVLVSDDGASEEVRRVAEAAAARDARVRYWRNPRTLGLAGNWNAIVQQARGDFVALIGDDDRLLPDFAGHLVTAAAAGVDVAFADHHLIDATGARLEAATREHSRRYERDRMPAGLVDAEAYVWKNSIPACAALIRTESLRRFPFREDLNTPEIEVFARLVAAGGRFVFVPGFVMEYRVHPGSQTTSGLRSEELVKYLAPLAVSARAEPLKRRFMEGLLEDATGRLLARGEVGRARELVASPFYPHGARPKLWIQRACSRLPGAVGRPLYLAARAVGGGMRGR
ncbi:MAG TPA: glycosyltransferase [Myxococcaceae bacterium]|jgi:glycosyltransferase involved in cell wall biosynthesis